MYRFALRPRWLIAHTVVVGIAVACVLLGLWQLRRYDERKAFNATLDRRAAAAPAPLSPDDPPYARVTVDGRYDTRREVILRSRSHQGRSGHHVLTPLVVDGRAVIVDRGWVPFEMDDPPIDAAPPTGRVEVTGMLVPNEKGFPLGPRDPSEGTLEAISRLDVGRLASQLPYDVHPLAIRLTEQIPTQPVELPIPAPVTRLDATRNLSYAVQWFLFIPVGLIGYGVILRKAARRGEAGGQGADAELTPIPS